MATYKCSMLMTLTTNTTGAAIGTRVGGWSESWYSSRDGILLLPTEFISLCRARAALLPTGARIVGQRYQSVDPIGSSSTTAISLPGTAGTACDIPSMSLFYRARGVGVLNNRAIYLRGVPDARVAEGEYAPSDVYTRALTAFFTALRDWRFRGKTLVAAAAPFLTITAGAANVGTYITTVAQTWAVGNIVTVTGVLVDGRKVEGRYRVATVTTSQTGTLDNWTFASGTGGKGYFQSVIYPLVDPASLEPNSGRAVNRKVGRPFGQFRGRASTRR